MSNEYLVIHMVSPCITTEIKLYEAVYATIRHYLVTAWGFPYLAEVCLPPNQAQQLEDGHLRKHLNNQLEWVWLFAGPSFTELMLILKTLRFKMELEFEGPFRDVVNPFGDGCRDATGVRIPVYRFWVTCQGVKTQIATQQADCCGSHF